jgi:hypothetical protein
MQSFLVANREFECLLISGDNEDLAHAVQQYRATAAMGKVAFDFTAQFSIRVALNVGRQISG